LLKTFGALWAVVAGRVGYFVIDALLWTPLTH
jgi:hypothetical protein